jgi:hypothetical protein
VTLELTPHTPSEETPTMADPMIKKHSSCGPETHKFRAEESVQKSSNYAWDVVKPPAYGQSLSGATTETHTIAFSSEHHEYSATPTPRGPRRNRMTETVTVLRRLSGKPNYGSVRSSVGELDHYTTGTPSEPDESNHGSVDPSLYADDDIKTVTPLEPDDSDHASERPSEDAEDRSIAGSPSEPGQSNHGSMRSTVGELDHYTTRSVVADEHSTTRTPSEPDESHHVSVRPSVDANEDSTAITPSESKLEESNAGPVGPSLRPDEDSTTETSSGMAAPEVNGCPSDGDTLPDGVHFVERLLQKQWSAGKLWLKIKWKGLPTGTWELADHMRSELGEQDYEELLETKPRKRRKKAAKW